MFIACLLTAAAGWAVFSLLALAFKPPRPPLCQPAPAYVARHLAEG